MGTPRGAPREELSKQEQFIARRLKRTGKLFAFLRLKRMAIFQASTGESDAEAVEHAILDARWQLVLDTLGRKKPAFSQGTLQAFRERLIAHDMDRRLLERTIVVARESTALDWKKRPRKLRVPSIPGLSSARAGSRTPSTCWPTRPERF